MNRAEAQELDEQWRDFVGWANGRLVRSGRCHESEIQTAFRKQVGGWEQGGRLGGLVGGWGEGGGWREWGGGGGVLTGSGGPG